MADGLSTKLKRKGCIRKKEKLFKDKETNSSAEIRNESMEVINDDDDVVESIVELRTPEIDQESTRSYYRKAFATLMELISTERTYVTRDLEKAMEFIAYCKKSKTKEDGVELMPVELRKGRDKIVFGNIQDILIFHKK